MYVQDYLVKERQQERFRQVEHGRAAYQVAELRKLEKRRQRVERQLLKAWRRTEEFWSVIGEG